MKVPSSEFRVPSFWPLGNTPRDRTQGASRHNSELGTRNWTAALLALLILASPLSAQSDSLIRRSSPFAVKYGKWAMVVAAIGMGMKAADDHDAADRAFNRLTNYCEAQSEGCLKGPGGKYIDPKAESYYQASISKDRHARAWLLGGEATMLGAVGLFVWELSRPKSLPRNIPFAPELEWTPARTRLIGKIRF